MSDRIDPVAMHGDLTNLVKDLREEFTTIIQAGDGLLKHIGEEDREFYGEDGKVQWLEDVEEREYDKLNNGTPVLAAADSFKVENISRFAVDMVVQFRGNEETMIVTGIDTGSSTVRVSRSRNGLTPPVTVADESYIDIISHSVREYNRANEVGLFKPTTEYNYYETLRVDIPLSEKVANSKMYGFKGKASYISYNEERYMRVLRQRLNRTAVKGERYSTSETTAGSMRGVYTWLRKTGTIKADGSGADVTSDQINNILESIYKKDAMATRDGMILYMDTIQARKMALLNTAVRNRMETVSFDSKIASGATGVTLFHSDLEATGMPTIVVDNEAPAGAIMALCKPRLKLVYGPKGRLQEWDSKPKDLPPDAMRRGMIMTASLMMQNHTQSHGLIYNLKQTM